MRSSKCALVLSCVLGFYGANGFAQQIHADATVRGATADNVPGEVIVKFREPVSDAAAEGLVQRHGALAKAARRKGHYHVVHVPAGKTEAALVAELKGEPDVEFAEPNGVVRALMVPNDPYYQAQWDFHGASGNIDVERAWDIQMGSPSVIVAVIDTGVAYETYGSYKQAPDLAGATFVAGFDYINNDTHANDDNGHGTHVTGTIAQSTNNGIGVAGIASRCAIMPVKVLDRSGSGSIDQVAQGIYFAADNGAKVINLSMGTSGDYATMRNAVQYAYNKGVTICAAAGNSSIPTVDYPAGYTSYVIAVGATRYDETLSYYSSYGPGLDLVAPGGDMTVDQNGDGYGDGIMQNTFSGSPTAFGYYLFQGTSMATPHVSGVAALLISSGITGPDNVRARLEQTAKHLGSPGKNSTYGYGLVDAYRALTMSSTSTADVAVNSVTAPSSVYQGQTVGILVSVTNSGNSAETFGVSVSESPGGASIGSQTVTSLAAGASTTLSFSWNTATASPGAHSLTATASAVVGEANLSNNAASTTVRVLGPAIHIGSLVMSIRQFDRKEAGRATVTIVDAGGAPVSGASVKAAWSGSASGTATNQTNRSGQIVFQSSRERAPVTFNFTVISVSKKGYLYDSSSNARTSAAISYP